jgi:hypothetical protein
MVLRISIILSLLLHQSTTDDSYLNWTDKQAVEVGKSMRATGHVKGTGRGLLNTEKARGYKIRATWLTPEVIRASARLHQIRNRLSEDQAKSIVAKAEALADTAFIIEIDPDEGSGVIPSDWQAFLGPRVAKGERGMTSVGTAVPSFREEAGLAGVFPRDYNYDLYWVRFPLYSKEGKPLFSESNHEAELTVRIESKEGRVKFLIPESIRKSVKCGQ